MGLMNELEEMKKNLDEMNQEEDAPKDDAPEEEEPKADEPEGGDTPEDDAEPAEGDEDGAPEEPKPEDEKSTNAAMARMRRELAAAKKRLREQEDSSFTPQPTAQKAERSKDDPEPDVNTNPVEWVKWNKRQTDLQLNEFKEWRETQRKSQERSELVTNAAKELSTYEAEFKAQVDDYEPVSEFMIGELKKSFKRLSPQASDEQITSAVQSHVLNEASKFAQQGLNPIEEFYHLAKEQYGYVAPTEEAPSKPAKPDMAKVAANRARNAGVASASGSAQRRAPATKEDAVNLSPAEWNKLSVEEKQRIMSGQ